MNNGYREHKIRTSLGRSAAQVPETSEQLKRRAGEAWCIGGSAMFFPDQLAAMSEQERAAIESAARRIYGERRA